MSAPPLLSAAAGTGSRQSRSASKAVVKAASGYHVFRIEGYSLTKTIPGGEKISSQDFTVGSRTWSVDMYPNGTDSSRDESDAIALYLVYHGEQATNYRHRHRRRHGHDQKLNRLGAQYKFSLLDHAGDAAYELPAKKGVFTRSRDGDHGCGHDAFISKDELEQRRARLLLKDGCLAIRCDVDVIDHLRIQSIAIGAKRRRSRYSDDTDSGRSSYSDHTDADSSSYSGYTDSGRSSYSDYTDTDSSSYSDDSRFDSDNDESRSSRRQNKRHCRQPTQLEEELALRTYES